MKARTDSSETQTRRIAVLIDGDTISRADFAPLFKELERQGSVVLRLMYAAEHLIKKMAADLNKFNITSVPVPTRAAHKSAMIRDVALLAAPEASDSPLSRANVQVAVLASVDMDLSVQCLGPLQSQQRVHAYYAGRNFPDLGIIPSTLDTMQRVGATVMPYDFSPRRPSVIVTLHGDVAKVKTGEEVPYQTFMDPVKLASARQVLSRLGYLPTETDGHLIAAAARFFYVNKLGPIVVFPAPVGENQLLEALAARPHESWKRDPGGLVYIVPVGTTGSNWRKKFGTSDAAAFARGGGPFILHNSSKLVSEVLIRLGYLDKDRLDQTTPAFKLFCKINKKKLGRRGLDIEITHHGEIEESVIAAFNDPFDRQDWKIVQSDDSMRKFLKSKGYLSKTNQPRSEVRKAAAKFLEKAGWLNDPLPKYYHAAVSRFQEWYNRDDPGLSK